MPVKASDLIALGSMCVAAVSACIALWSLSIAKHSEERQTAAEAQAQALRVVVYQDSLGNVRIENLSDLPIVNVKYRLTRDPKKTSALDPTEITYTSWDLPPCTEIFVVYPQDEWDLGDVTFTDNRGTTWRRSPRAGAPSQTVDITDAVEPPEGRPKILQLTGC